MMCIVSAFYLLGLWVYGVGVSIAALFNQKAKLLCQGRRATWSRIADAGNLEGCVWVHAASLGEFEQGRPIIESIKERFPGRKVVLTFYSPSGYEVRKNYAKADLICYLPADGPANARKFLDAIKPSAVFFVKYEFWHFFLKAVKDRNIPIYGVSMIFRPQQPFFQVWGDWFRGMIRRFSHIYVQDEQSAKLLDSIGFSSYTVAGDTRFDRVRQIADSAADVPSISLFAKQATQVIVAGSTWPPDEDVLVPFVCNPSNDVKLVIAPHEIGKARVDALAARLTVPYARFTELSSLSDEQIAAAKVFIVDTIGILSAIYRYGTITYVGGGFGVGIHNTLEPAIYGLPVFFGPNHAKFKEALDLIACGGGITFSNAQQFNEKMLDIMVNPDKLAAAGKAAGDYCQSMLGATAKIMADVSPILAK